MVHKEHFHNGQRLVSVTELQSIISKPFLNKWRLGLCSVEQGQCGFVRADQLATEAADLGNKVHEEVARYLSTGEKSVEPWADRIIIKLQELHIQKYLIEPESTLIDNESGLAGSPDFIGQYPGCTIGFIGDLKIKNSLDSLTALQGCGYRYLIKRKHNVNINTMVVVWAKKKTKSMIVEAVWIDLDKWQKEWESLVCLWNRLNPSRRVTLYE